MTSDTHSVETCPWCNHTQGDYFCWCPYCMADDIIENGWLDYQEQVELHGLCPPHADGRRTCYLVGCTSGPVED